MRTFTKDETYALTEQFKYGDAMANRDTGRADMHKRSVRYNQGSLTAHELKTAYALGHSGCSNPPALFGDGNDYRQLPSVAVHVLLGYRVSSEWRGWAWRIINHGLHDTPQATEWVAEVEAADAAMAQT